MGLSLAFDKLEVGHELTRCDERARYALGPRNFRWSVQKDFCCNTIHQEERFGDRCEAWRDQQVTSSVCPKALE